jgi:parallel beta-helix repeat protein
VSPGNALIFGNPVLIIGAGVTVDGSSLVSTTLRLNSPGSSVSGINFVNVPDAEIVADDTTFDSNTFNGTSQLEVDAPNAVITGNRIIGTSDSLASLYVTSAGTGSVIAENTAGILTDGTAEDAVPTVGIYIEASDVIISENQVASHTYGIAGARSTGITVSNNLVGGAEGAMGASESA